MKYIKHISRCPYNIMQLYRPMDRAWVAGITCTTHCQHYIGKDKDNLYCKIEEKLKKIMEILK